MIFGGVERPLLVRELAGSCRERPESNYGTHPLGKLAEAARDAVAYCVVGCQLAASRG